MADDDGAQNVKVMVRVRPFNSRELALAENQPDDLRSVLEMENNTVRVFDHEHNFTERDAFEFDECFWSIPESQKQLSSKPFATQEMVFEKTGAPAVENAMSGYHNTIFAYGQTGSGKTFSMLGSDEYEGIAPRLVRRLFARIREERQSNPHERIQYQVELSFLEIYNERVKDLLMQAQKSEQEQMSKSGNKKEGEQYSECRVRQHPEKGTFVEGLMRLNIESEEQCLHAIKDGMEHRAVTSTLMNATSSRSHAIFQICLTQKSPLRGTSRVSIINLVDLAGSERIKMSGVSGQALQEAKNINQSLSTLRRVIDVLIDNSRLKKGQRPSVPPYRESLLTWVLSDSLGGNSRTVMVAAVSPYSGNIEDTMGTLRYALKAKAIVCHAKVNEEKTAAVVHQLRSEMETLRKKLEEKAASDVAERERIETTLKEREEEVQKMQDDSKRLDELKSQYETELATKAVEMERAQEQISALDNVEDERRQKEAELENARAAAEATARQLAQQQEERKKRDAELEAALARKAALEAHHDRAATEEVRAKLESEQARTRQFASAFQSAFVLNKQRSGLDELKRENQQLRDRFNELEAAANESERQTNILSEEKASLEHNVEVLDRKCQSMLKDLQAVMKGKTERIEDLTRQKENVGSELDKLRVELDRRRDEHDKLKQLHHDETRALQEKHDDLKHQQTQCQRDIEVRKANIESLDKMLNVAKAETTRLHDQAGDLEKQGAELREQVKHREAQVEELKKKRDQHTVARDDAQQQLAERRDELATANRDFGSVQAEIELLQQNHRELRDFVSAHFFPTASGARAKMSLASSANPPQNSAGNGSHSGGAAVLSPKNPRGRSPPAGRGTTAATPTSPVNAPAGAVAVRSYTSRGVRYQHGAPTAFAKSTVSTASSRR